MPKKNKTLCVDDLRHAEYYGMQPVFDELYHRSLEGENFTDLMDLILSRDIKCLIFIIRFFEIIYCMPDNISMILSDKR